MTDFTGIQLTSGMARNSKGPLDKKMELSTIERLGLLNTQRSIGMITYDTDFAVWKVLINDPAGDSTTEADWEDFGSGGTSIPEKTYTELQIMVAGGDLVAGKTYKMIDYVSENEPGLSLPTHYGTVEPMYLVATSDTTFNDVIQSVSFSSDYIVYDFTTNKINVREDVVNSVFCPYDFRGYRYARCLVDGASVQAYVGGAYTSGIFVRSGNEIYFCVRSTSYGLTYNDWILIVEDYTTDYVAHASTLMFHALPINTASAQAIPVFSSEVSPGVYTQDVDKFTNVICNTDGVVFISSATGCKDIYVTEGCIGLTLCGTINNFNAYGDTNNCLLLMSSTISGVDVNESTVSCFLGDVSNTTISGGLFGTYLGEVDNTVLDGGFFMFISKCTRTTFGAGCANLNLGSTTNNTFGVSCQNIAAYLSLNNNYGDGCQNINILTGTFSGNTFGDSCRNIYGSGTRYITDNTFGNDFGNATTTFDFPFEFRNNIIGNECNSTNDNFWTLGTTLNCKFGSNVEYLDLARSENCYFGNNVETISSNAQMNSDVFESGVNNISHTTTGIDPLSGIVFGIGCNNISINLTGQIFTNNIFGQYISALSFDGTETHVYEEYKCDIILGRDGTGTKTLLTYLDGTTLSMYITTPDK